MGTTIFSETRLGSQVGCCGLLGAVEAERRLIQGEALCIRLL